MASRGLLITLEGPEGGGKTTQAPRLEQYLRDAGYEVRVYNEPGGTRISEAIRDILLAPRHTEMAAFAELFLFLASRAQLVEESIRPALEAGQIVLCDRYTDSTLAYQRVATRLSVRELDALNDLATGSLQPDLTLLLDVPAEVGLRRQGKWNRMEALGLDFHRSVREEYLALRERYPKRIVLIDASQPLDQVALQMQEAVDQLLALHRQPAAQAVSA
jgi:dTMP kinase